MVAWCMRRYVGLLASGVHALKLAPLAQQAFDEGPWPRMTGEQRARVLLRLADLVEVRSPAAAPPAAAPHRTRLPSSRAGCMLGWLHAWPGMPDVGLAHALPAVVACPQCKRPPCFIQEHSDELALLETLNNGKTYTQVGRQGGHARPHGLRSHRAPAHFFGKAQNQRPGRGSWRPWSRWPPLPTPTCGLHLRPPPTPLALCRPPSACRAAPLTCLGQPSTSDTSRGGATKSRVRWAGHAPW